jgi:hypothetical protein
MNRPVVQITSVEGHKFWVDERFVKKVCFNPSVETAYSLLNSYSMRRYLHNINGPATINTNGEEGYWLLGSYKSKKDWELETKDIRFSNKIQDIINE